MTDFLGIAPIPAITVLCYLLAEGIKATSLDNKWLPVICGFFGGVLGIASLFVVPDFVAHDALSAAAVGVVSGLAATGIHQIGKQLSKAEEADDYKGAHES